MIPYDKFSDWEIEKECRKIGLDTADQTRAENTKALEQFYEKSPTNSRPSLPRTTFHVDKGADYNEFPGFQLQIEGQAHDLPIPIKPTKTESVDLLLQHDEMTLLKRLNSVSWERFSNDLTEFYKRATQIRDNSKRDDFERECFEESEKLRSTLTEDLKTFMAWQAERMRLLKTDQEVKRKDLDVELQRQRDAQIGKDFLSTAYSEVATLMKRKMDRGVAQREESHIAQNAAKATAVKDSSLGDTTDTNNTSVGASQPPNHLHVSETLQLPKPTQKPAPNVSIDGHARDSPTLRPEREDAIEKHLRATDLRRHAVVILYGLNGPLGTDQFDIIKRAANGRPVVRSNGDEYFVQYQNNRTGRELARRFHNRVATGRTGLGQHYRSRTAIPQPPQGLARGQAAGDVSQGRKRRGSDLAGHQPKKLNLGLASLESSKSAEGGKSCHFTSAVSVSSPLGKRMQSNTPSQLPENAPSSTHLETALESPKVNVSLVTPVTSLEAAQPSTPTTSNRPSETSHSDEEFLKVNISWMNIEKKLGDTPYTIAAAQLSSNRRAKFTPLTTEQLQLLVKHVKDSNKTVRGIMVSRNGYIYFSFQTLRKEKMTQRLSVRTVDCPSTAVKCGPWGNIASGIDTNQPAARLDHIGMDGKSRDNMWLVVILFLDLVDILVSQLPFFAC